jgi:hypothetical protein
VSDVITAAAIAACVGVVGNGVTAFVALRTTAAHVKAAAARLGGEHHEARRQARVEAYRGLLAMFSRFDMAATGWVAEGQTYVGDLDEFNRYATTVGLLGTSAVADAVSRLRDTRGAIGAVMDDDPEGGTPIDRLGRAWRAHRDALTSERLLPTPSQ